MRYVKVLLWVLVFFFVMLFFVQNQAAFSQEMMLKLDLLFFTFESASPVHFYTLLLGMFLLGALMTFFMLVWDRLSLAARVGMSTIKIRGLERDATKTLKVRTGLETSLEETKTKLGAVETQLSETQAQGKTELDAAVTQLSEAQAQGKTELDAAAKQLSEAQAKNAELEKALASVQNTVSFEK